MELKLTKEQVEEYLTWFNKHKPRSISKLAFADWLILHAEVERLLDENRTLCKKNSELRDELSDLKDF